MYGRGTVYTYLWANAWRRRRAGGISVPGDGTWL